MGSTPAGAVAAPGPSPGRRRGLRKVIGASLIGTTLEWYDFFIYGSAAALVFNTIFFPEFDPLVGTLLAFATYAVGFVARPLGGDRKSTRLNSSHANISYAVFCLKKK